MKTSGNNENRIVNEFLRLASIDSLSLKEREMADAIKDILKELEIVYSEDDAAEKNGGNAGNIFAKWKGDNSTSPILLSAHMDTVVPGTGKKPVLKDGIIKSDSDTVLGADDIAGITEILEGIRRVKESGINHRTVEILFSVAEETYTKGASAFDYSKVSAKEAYCFDLSGDVGIAVNKAPSLISFRVTVKGKASHAGFAPDDGINAILVSAQAIAQIKQGKVDEESTLNIGTIKGGSATNIVSEECIVEGEIRSFKHERALSLYNEILEKFDDEAKKTGALIEAEYTIHLKAYEVNSNSDVVKRFLASCEELGIEGSLDSTFGGADNHQFNANKIEGIVLSCGMEKVHTKDEYVTVENLEKGARLVEKLITLD